MDAAIKVFSKKGYHDARVDEIVTESSTSKGAVYFYFPSKQKIFLAIVDEFAGLLEKKMLQAIEHQPDGVRRVNAALQMGLETFGKYRSLAKIFLVQAVGLAMRLLSGGCIPGNLSLSGFLLLYARCCCAVLGFQMLESRNSRR
jgi:AcrR family transcriptional regulator